MDARRRIRWFVMAATAAFLLLPAVPASAGGGCHEASEGTGDAVVIEHACFTPSILHVDAGTPVRFENRDLFEHNLYGTGWGAGELAAGDSWRVSFADDGLYAFQCTLHPGMTGTVVVGDGDGAGNGASVTVASAADAPAPPAPPAASETGSSLPAAGAGLVVGLAVGAGAMVLASRRRRPAAVPATA